MKIEDVKIVDGYAVGAYEYIKQQHAKRLKTDAKYRRTCERSDERQTRALARTFARGGKRLKELREIPGYTADVENEERTKNAMQIAILEARKRSGYTQAEIAKRMGIPQPNVSRIEHKADALTYKTFAAYLRACGFAFSVALSPLRD